MATKTISIDLEAYNRLAISRMHEKESFSKVIKRATWPRAKTTGLDLLEALQTLPALDRETIEELERNQKLDAPPKDVWN